MNQGVITWTRQRSRWWPGAKRKFYKGRNSDKDANDRSFFFLIVTTLTCTIICTLYSNSHPKNLIFVFHMYWRPRLNISSGNCTSAQLQPCWWSWQNEVTVLTPRLKRPQWPSLTDWVCVWQVAEPLLTLTRPPLLMGINSVGMSHGLALLS